MKSRIDHINDPDAEGYVLLRHPQRGLRRAFGVLDGVCVSVAGSLSLATVFSTVEEAEARRGGRFTVRSYLSMQPRKKT